MNLEWRTLEPDRLVSAGAVAFSLREHLADIGSPGVVVQGLRVFEPQSGLAARFVAGSGLYAFQRLPPGTHRLTVQDPSDRYVPRVLLAVVPDRRAAIAALNAGLPPAEDRAALLRQLTQQALVRPGVGAGVPPGQTVVWGDVVDASGAPVPFAFVRVTAANTTVRWSTTTDAQGRFLVWLRGLPAKEPNDTGATVAARTPTAILRVFVRGRAATTDPFAALPTDFDDMISKSTNTAINTWYPIAAPVRPATVRYGERTRVSTIQLPST